MYQLYAYPNTYSFGVHLLLEETATPYEIINPKLNPAATDAAFYRSSPHGRVPALILPDGTSMCESGAIALHLADTLSDQRFTVKPGSPDRPHYLQWLFYLSSTLQPDVMLVFHPEYYFAQREQQSALIEAAEQRLEKVWPVLEQQYTNGPWMFGDAPTAVDFALTTVLVWPECFPTSLNSYPSLLRMLDTMSQRASFKTIVPWHRGATEYQPKSVIPE